MYKKYVDLLNNKAELEAVQFTKDDHYLDEYVDMINKYEVLCYDIIYCKLYHIT